MTDIHLQSLRADSAFQVINKDAIYDYSWECPLVVCLLFEDIWMAFRSQVI